MYFYTDSPSWLLLPPLQKPYLFNFNNSASTKTGRRRISKMIYTGYSSLKVMYASALSEKPLDLIFNIYSVSVVVVGVS